MNRKIITLLIVSLFVLAAVAVYYWRDRWQPAPAIPVEEPPTADTVIVQEEVTPVVSPETAALEPTIEGDVMGPAVVDEPEPMPEAVADAKPVAIPAPELSSVEKEGEALVSTTVSMEESVEVLPPERRSDDSVTAEEEVVLAPQQETKEPAAMSEPSPLLEIDQEDVVEITEEKAESLSGPAQPVVPSDLSDSERLELNITNGIAAVVEDRVFTVDEVRRELAPLMLQLQSEARSPAELESKANYHGREILKSKIDDYLIVKEFRDKKYQIPKSLIDKEYKNFLIENFDNDKKRLHDYLKTQGKTVRQFRNDLEEQMIVGAMRSRHYRSQSAVSPQKIESFYNENKNDFYQEASIELCQIIINRGRLESPEMLQARAQRIIEELDQGAPFATKAQEYSEDVRGKSGGNWGWLKQSDLRPELSRVAFALDKGQYSQPVVLENTAFILYAKDKKAAGIQPLTEVREQIEVTLSVQLAREASEQWLDGLREKAYIRYFL